MRCPNCEDLEMIEEIDELHDEPTGRCVCPECGYEEMR